MAMHGNDSPKSPIFMKFAIGDQRLR